MAWTVDTSAFKTINVWGSPKDSTASTPLPTAALLTKQQPEEDPCRNPAKKAESQFIEGCTFGPQGNESALLKKDVLSFNFACRVCETGPLFVRVFGEFCEVTHMWLIKTAPCDLWRCSERFCGPPPPARFLYLYQIQSFKNSGFWWNWSEWGARWPDSPWLRDLPSMFTSTPTAKLTLIYLNGLTLILVFRRLGRGFAAGRLQS